MNHFSRSQNKNQRKKFIRTRGQKQLIARVKKKLRSKHKIHNRKTAPSPKNLIGTVKRHPDGFGFLIPLNTLYPDVYLPRKQMLGLMSGDQIEVATAHRRGRKGLLLGKVVQITKRCTKHIIGPCQMVSAKTGKIQDDSFGWGEDCKVTLDKTQNIQAGEWIEARITHWPGSREGFSGYMIAKLGRFHAGLEDNVRVMQKNNIPVSFPSNCLKETKKYTEKLPTPIQQNRKDLRHLPFVTIDSETAADFDDAIFVTDSTLYVAIADVSHYVPMGSVLDTCARERGNSTYFPGFVSPMLPETLSNHLCSLQPNVDRLAFVSEIHFNSVSEKKNARFYPAVIQSSMRLNYGQAQDIIDTHLRPPTHPAKLNVWMAAKLARQLLNLRIKKHFIQLDIPETKVLLNSVGEPKDIIASKRLFSHQMIEELMLAANQSVAEFLSRKKVASLYRIHNPPKNESLIFLESFAQNLGMKIRISPPNLHKKISQIIQHFAHHTLSPILQILVLRSLSQAVYSAHRKEHFGLNFSHYTHFTSPIRRYSDLVVHRILKAKLMGKQNPYPLKELESIASLTSTTEQRSMKAERQIKDIKKARFLKKYLGEQMKGMICSVVKFGFFVRLKLYDIEGLVHIDRLKGVWRFEETMLQLVAKKSGKRFKIGDFVEVQVISSNIETGQIDFDLKKH